MKKALIYCRVSSDRQRTEGHGLDSQEQRCRIYAVANNLEVEKVFNDSASGGGDFMKRPAMASMLGYVDANPHKEYSVIFDDLSRFARDKEFHLKLAAAFKARNVERHCLNYNFDDSPEGHFAEVIMAANNELDREKNKRQVIQKQKARLERGYWPFGAVSGYVQLDDLEHGKVLTPSREKKVELIREALDGFGSGRFDTKSDAVTFLGESGYSKRPTIETFNRLLDNLPIYAGFIEYPKWDVEIRDGFHEAIISAKTYRAIKEKLEQRNRTHVRRVLNPDFPLRGFLLCSDCCKPVTASWTTKKKGKFAYYRCNNKSCVSGGKSVPKGTIESEFEELLGRIEPGKEVLSLTKAVILDLWQKKQKNIDKFEDDQKAKLKNLIIEKDRLIKRLVLTDDVEVVKLFEERLSEISREMVVLKSEIMSAGEKRPDIETATEIVFDFLENPLKQWQNGDIHTRKLVLKLVFEEPLAYNRKSGFETANLSLPLRVFSLPDTQNVANVEMAVLKPRPNW